MESSSILRSIGVILENFLGNEGGVNNVGLAGKLGKIHILSLKRRINN
jgi:hypothetical protein